MLLWTSVTIICVKHNTCTQTSKKVIGCQFVSFHILYMCEFEAFDENKLGFEIVATMFIHVHTSTSMTTFFMAKTVDLSNGQSELKSCCLQLMKGVHQKQNNNPKTLVSLRDVTGVVFLYSAEEMWARDAMPRWRWCTWNHINGCEQDVTLHRRWVIAADTEDQCHKVKMSTGQIGFEATKRQIWWWVTCVFESGCV